MIETSPIRVLFVCMGNICRSPTAHGVFKSLVAEQHLESLIEVDSAGTGSYHVGSPPDRRSQTVANAHGVDLSTLAARRFQSTDFYDFDYLIGMDHANRDDMLAIRPDDSDREVNLMLDFAKIHLRREVPDPYFGEDGFDLVFDMIDEASRGLLDEIRKTRGI